MYNRYRAIESLAYDLRKRLSKMTRVKIGKGNIELFCKDAGSRFWNKHVLPEDLPNFEV